MNACTRKIGSFSLNVHNIIQMFIIFVMAQYNYDFLLKYNLLFELKILQKKYTPYYLCFLTNKIF